MECSNVKKAQRLVNEEDRERLIKELQKDVDKAKTKKKKQKVKNIFRKHKEKLIHILSIINGQHRRNLLLVLLKKETEAKLFSFQKWLIIIFLQDITLKELVQNILMMDTFS
jgi:hypothetical protein